jgi:hypothetical protein
MNIFGFQVPKITQKIPLILFVVFAAGAATNTQAAGAATNTQAAGAATSTQAAETEPTNGVDTAKAASSIADDEGSRTEAQSRGPASVTVENGVTVYQLDPRMRVERLKKKGYRVRMVSDIPKENPWLDPSPRLRDKVLARARLGSKTKGWDTLAKDMLFLRAQEQPLENMIAFYPKFSREELVRLQGAIRQAKGEANGESQGDAQGATRGAKK